MTEDEMEEEEKKEGKYEGGQFALRETKKKTRWLINSLILVSLPLGDGRVCRTSLIRRL